jgi:hypothetical protein
MQKDVCDLQVFNTNGFNEEVVSYMPKSSQFGKNDDKPFLESCDELLPKEDSSLPFLTPRTLKVVPTVSSLLAKKHFYSTSPSWGTFVGISNFSHMLPILLLLELFCDFYLSY